MTRPDCEWQSLFEGLMRKLHTLGWDKDAHQTEDKWGCLCFYVGDDSRPEIWFKLFVPVAKINSIIQRGLDS